MHLHIDTTLFTPTSPLHTTAARPASTPTVPQTSSSNGTQQEGTNPLTQNTGDVVEILSNNTELSELKARDREVRAHEAAHAAAGGALTTGGPQFTYQRGSDGRLYAVGGEVNIDTSPVAGNPRKTIEKAQRIRAAALAPANPSAQDRSVAAAATRMEAQARLELQQERTERLGNSTPSTLIPSFSKPHLLDLFA